MEEPKRVQFTTLEGSQKNEKTASLRKSVRFNLDLPATTDTTCPEFSFTELLKSVAVSADFGLERYIFDCFTMSNKENMAVHSLFV